MPSEKPPMEKSGEAKPEQLDLAREQGRAYERALMEMTQKEAHGQQKQGGGCGSGVADGSRGEGQRPNSRRPNRLWRARARRSGRRVGMDEQVSSVHGW